MPRSPENASLKCEAGPVGVSHDAYKINLKLDEPHPHESVKNLLRAIQNAKTPKDALEIVATMFEPYELIMVGKRFFYLQCLVRNDSPGSYVFSDNVDERFVFASVSFMVRHRKSLTKLRKLLSFE